MTTREGGMGGLGGATCFLERVTRASLFSREEEEAREERRKVSKSKANAVNRRKGGGKKEKGREGGEGLLLLWLMSYVVAVGPVNQESRF